MSLLACERNLQDFSLSQKIGVIPQIHSAFHGFSPTKPKTCAIWVRKDLLRWVLFTCSWFNSFNCLWTCFVFVFGCFFFLGCFLLKKKKIQKHWKISKRKKYFIFCVVLFFLRITWIVISLSWFRTCWTLWINLNNMCYISAKLFLILCEYALVCTRTQGLIKKLIFLVCVPSIA